MADLSWAEQAMSAFEAGDGVKTIAILNGHEQDMWEHPSLLQIYALSLEDRYLGRALLELAARDLFPGNPGCHYNLAIVNQGFDLLAEAERGYIQCLRLCPDHSGALNNLSDLLRRRGRIGDAWILIQRYIACGYPTSDLEMRVAKIADEVGEKEIAHRFFLQAKAAAPGDPNAAWEAALADLRDGRFAEGWQGYEARGAIYSHAVLGQVTYDLPEWDGRPLAGRSLLLHKEQGLGDMIMFASCIADLSLQRDDNVNIAVQAPLARLFAYNFPDAKVWASESSAQEPTAAGQHWLKAADPIDCQLPLASLGRLTRMDGFPKPMPYFHADPNEVDIWKQRLSQIAPLNDLADIRAGLVFSARRNGSLEPGVADGKGKSVPAYVGTILAGVEGVSWVSLHNRETADYMADLPAIDLIDASPWLLDMADTAALISNLDVVVAVDTAVAHLAGAMGKKTLLMLRQRADWRWGRDEKHSVWYQDVEIFRQQCEGAWHVVMDNVAARLTELVQDRRRADEGDRFINDRAG